MKKTYKVVISALGNREESELKLGYETFLREGFDGHFTNFSKPVVGFRESRDCLELALCNAQRQDMGGIGGVIVNM